MPSSDRARPNSKSITGNSRQPQRTSLPVPMTEGSNPTTVEHASTASPKGPVSSSVSTVSTASTDLLMALGLSLPMIPTIALPDHMAIQYPSRAATAVDISNSRNPWDMNPVRDSPATSPMASAVPDLPLPETDRVTMERTEVTVPIEATVAMKRSGRFSGITATDMDAPTVAVIPGNHPATAPIRTPFSPGHGPTGSRTVSRCSGTLAPFDVSSSTGTPNSPVRSGSITLPSPRMPSTGTGSVMHARPRNPDIAKATSPQGPEPRPNSPPMRTAAADRSTSGVRLSRGPSRPFRSIHCSGTDIRIDADAPIRLPIAAALTASMPLPSSSNLCPGSTDTASSPSGAPMNTDGTKSTNE